MIEMQHEIERIKKSEQETGNSAAVEMQCEKEWIKKSKQDEVKNADVVIVGGGPAGLAAAIALYEKGVKDILIPV